MQDNISGWNDWDNAFSSLDELSGASELHGFITGILCTVQEPSHTEWAAILRLLDIKQLSDEALQLLIDEASDIAAALHEGELDYLPLLPDDEHDLSERVHALSLWCSGVIIGFGLTCGNISAEEAELIEHLQSVADITFTEHDNDEDGEQSYNELYEFVRLVPISLAMDRQKIAFQHLKLPSSSS